MPGRSPGLRRAAIGADALRRRAAVREGEHIRQRRRAVVAHAAGAPDLRVPGGDAAVLVGADLDIGECRGPIAADHQLQVAIQEHLHRLAGLFRQLDTGGAPSIGAELRTEAAAHVLAIDVNLVGFQARRPASTGRR